MAHFEAGQEFVGGAVMKAAKDSGKVGGIDSGFFSDLGHGFEAKVMGLQVTANALVSGPGSGVSNVAFDGLLGNFEQEGFDK